MDLRAYLEDDMTSFLDARLSVDFLKEQTAAGHAQDLAALLGKDYESMLFQALEAHDIPGAKKVLHDVKDQFAQKPVGSQERRELQSLLHLLYKRFKEYLESDATLKKMEHAIENVDKPEIAKKHLEGEFDEMSYGQALDPAKQEDASRTTPKTPMKQPPETHASEGIPEQAASPFADIPPPKEKTTLGESATETRAPPKQSAMTPAEVAAPETPHEQDLLATMHFLDEAIAERNIEHAYAYYQQAQSLFDKLPETRQHSLYDAMIHYHSTISELIRQATVSAPTITSNEQALVAAMKAGDLHEAMLQYEKLREETLLLNPEERRKHIPRLQEYHKRILSAWNAWQSTHAQASPLEQHERRLSGKP